MFGKLRIVFKSSGQSYEKMRAGKVWRRRNFSFLLWRLLVYWFKRVISPITLAWICILLKCYKVLVTEKLHNVLIFSLNSTYLRMYSYPVTLVSGNKLTTNLKPLFSVILQRRVSPMFKLFVKLFNKVLWIRPLWSILNIQIFIIVLTYGSKR